MIKSFKLKKITLVKLKARFKNEDSPFIIENSSSEKKLKIYAIIIYEVLSL